MLAKLRPRLTYANVVSTICLCLVVGGGSAYAANTIISTDIVDNQVYSVDVRNDNLSGGGLIAGDLRAGSVGASEVADNSLGGADILESSLAKVPNADAVDGLTASALTRTAYSAVTPTGYLENGRSTLASVTLVAPRAGFVTLTGAVAGDYNSACSSFCSIHARFRNATAGTEHGVTSASMPMGETTTRQSLSPAVTIPITAGTHTFELIGSWFNGNALTPTWRDPSLTAAFSPFNGSGGTTPTSAVSRGAGREGATPRAPDLRSSGD